MSDSGRVLPKWYHPYEPTPEGDLTWVLDAAIQWAEFHAGINESKPDDPGGILDAALRVRDALELKGLGPRLHLDGLEVAYDCSVGPDGVELSRNGAPVPIRDSEPGYYLRELTHAMLFDCTGDEHMADDYCDHYAGSVASMVELVAALESFEPSPDPATVPFGIADGSGRVKWTVTRSELLEWLQGVLHVPDGDADDKVEANGHVDLE